MEKFICKECNKEYSILSHLSIHVGKFHGDKKIYYDKYLKKEGEGICPICNNPTQYMNKWQNAYKIYCSKECKKIGVVKNLEKTSLKIYGKTNPNKTKKVRDKIDKTNKERYGNLCPMQNLEIQKNIRDKNLKKFGVEITFQSKEIRDKGALKREELYGAKYTYQSKQLNDKIVKTNNKKYGVDYPIQSEEIQKKIRKNNMEKYGVPYQITSEETQEKIKKTNNKKYGFDNCFNNKLIRKKIEKTMIERHGVSYSMQNREIFDRAFKTRIKIKQFRNLDIWYQGSYELDFLEKYYDNYTEIQRGSSFRYKFKNSNSIYHSDFYIPSLNLIIEIKNSYLVKRDKLRLKRKKEAVLKEGYQFIMIVDKNYIEFENLLFSLGYKE
jgi:hypothetical protein